MNQTLEPRLQKIHDSAVRAARELGRAESALIEILIEVDRERVFARMGYASLFVYLTDELKLTPAMANQAITVARRAAAIPALRAEIQAGTIGISVAKKMASVIHKSPSEWIDRAKTLTVRQLEKAVAKADPHSATPEKARYVSEHRISLSLGLSEEAMLKLRRAQDQVSRSENRAVSLEETLAVVVGFYLHRKDPIERSRRVVARKGIKVTSEPGLAPVADSLSGPKHGAVVPGPEEPSAPKPPGDRNQMVPGRRPLASAVKHAVRIRDGGKCQARKPGGGYCGSTRWLDLHHILPLSRGGNNAPSNLATLCRACHQRTHTADPDSPVFRPATGPGASQSRFT